MSAPALPRPDVAALRAEAHRLDAAYTQAIQDAARDDNWYRVPAAAHAAQQARSALQAAEGAALCHERHVLAPGIHQEIPHTHEDAK